MKRPDLQMPEGGAWLRWGLTLAGGALGGAVFQALNLPLPWMLGSMSAAAMAAVFGLGPSVPLRLRALMMMVLGLMLGSGFSPDFWSHVGSWTPSLIATLLYVLVVPIITAPLFRLLSGCGPVTSLYASAPGGVSEMVMIGGAQGGDEKAIALSHVLRIFLTIFIVPFWFRWTGELPVSARSAISGGPWDIGWPNALVLAGCVVAGIPFAKLLRMPAVILTGPLLASAAVHLVGWTASKPPGDLVAVAQVVIGSALGARFIGVEGRRAARILRAAFVSTLMMLALVAIFSEVLVQITGFPFALLLFALAPGGLAEMSLVSLAMGLDVAFVATHHLARILLVMTAAPMMFRWWAKRRKTPGD